MRGYQIQRLNFAAALDEAFHSLHTQGKIYLV